MDLSILQGLDELEASQLRSILLFESFKRNEEENTHLRKRVLLSIIVSGKGRYKEEQIKEIMKSRFAIEWDDDLQSALHNLITSQSVLKNTDGSLFANTEDQRGRIFFENLENKTKALIENIYHKYLLYQPVYTDMQTIIQHIRKALSAYYKTSGYAFFDIQKKDTSYPSVLASLDGLDEQTKSCLASAIGDTLSKPTDEELATLEIWAKAFVITQMTNLDPMLTNFRQEQLRNKSFVLDTDFMLYVLTFEATYSKEYYAILDYIKRLGCQIIVPDEVRREIRGCIHEAEEKIAEYGEEKLVQYGEAYFSYSNRNVFVEDFIRRCQKEGSKRFRFDRYIKNIYDSKNSIVFDENIRKLIGVENFKNKLDYVELDERLKESLQDKIFEKTKGTPKGEERRDEFNLKMSENDARLYLTLKTLNQENVDNGLFASKYYLLTRSTKTILCAKELKIYKDNIICNPQALTTVLQELGDIRSEISIINLFDNPFLAYVADTTWEKAEPLMKNGVELEYADTIRMRVDVNEHFEDVLTCETRDELKIVSEKYEGKGYKFTQKWVEAITETDRLSHENNAKDIIIEGLQKKVDRLEKRLSRSQYEDRVKKRGVSRFAKKKRK